MAVDSAKSTTTTVSQAIKYAYYDKLFLRIAESKLVHKQLGQLDRKIPQGEGGPTTAVSMSATNVTGSTAQYDAAVSISDILAYASFGDVMKAAMERLAYNAGISIDSIVRGVVSTAGTVQGATGVYWSAVPATATLTIGEIKKA